MDPTDRFQFSLRTAVILMLVASGLLYLTVRPGQTSWLQEIGWPETAITLDHRGLPVHPNIWDYRGKIDRYVASICIDVLFNGFLLYITVCICEWKTFGLRRKVSACGMAWLLIFTGGFVYLNIAPRTYGLSLPGPGTMTSYGFPFVYHQKPVYLFPAQVNLGLESAWCATYRVVCNALVLMLLLIVAGVIRRVAQPGTK